MRAQSVLEAASDEEMSPNGRKTKKHDILETDISDFEQAVSIEKMSQRPSKMKLPMIKSRIDIAHYFTPAWNKPPLISEKKKSEQHSSLSYSQSRDQKFQPKAFISDTARNCKLHGTHDVRDSIQKLMVKQIEDNNYRVPLSLLKQIDYNKRKKQSSLGAIHKKQMPEFKTDFSRCFKGQIQK